MALARLIADGRVTADIAVTCWDRNDGAGAQAHAVISTMVLARFAGCRYLHSPFTAMDHAIGAREEWAQRWEQFLNLGDGEMPLPDVAEMVRISEFVRNPRAYDGQRIVVAERAFGLPAGTVAPIKDILREGLRSKYWRSPKTAIPSHRAPDGFTVALHLRRGDVTEHSGRYVPEASALRQVARLRKALAPFGRPVTINVYSQGTPEDFRAFADAGCNLHISEDPFESFHNMVIADILMTASSSFSGVAALLSRGLILHSSPRWPRLSNYVRLRKNRDISIKRVRRALLQRMSWPARCAYYIRRRWQAARPD